MKTSEEEVRNDIEAISCLEKVATYYEVRDKTNIHSRRVRDEIAILHNRVFGEDGEFKVENKW